MDTEQDVKVLETICDVMIEGSKYTEYKLDNGYTLYTKEITDADILANLSDKEKEQVNHLFKLFAKDEDQELLNYLLEMVYRHVFMRLSDDYIIYTNGKETTKYNPTIEDEMNVDICHPLTNRSIPLNELMASLKIENQ